MGWMPLSALIWRLVIAVDLCAQRGFPASKAAQRSWSDFKHRYGATVLMAVLFLVLGAWGDARHRPQLFAGRCVFLRSTDRGLYAPAWGGGPIS